MNAVDAVKQLLLQSGSAWVLWLLALLSFLSAAIIVERWLFYRSGGGDLRAMAERLDGRLAAGDFAAVIHDLRSSGSVAGAIAAGRATPRRSRVGESKGGITWSVDVRW